MSRSSWLWPSFLALALFSLARGAPCQAQQKTKADRENLERLWNDLAGSDALQANRAIWALTRTPSETVAFIAETLLATVAPDPAKVEQWIQELNSAVFPVRERANRQLESLGQVAGPALRKARKTELPLELRQRVERILDRLQGPVTLPAELRAVRTVETLEQLGTAAARTLLQKYASGAALAPLTEEARESLSRLERSEPPALLTERENRTRVDLYGDALPEGAVARLGTVRFRRNADGYGLAGLAFLEDGTTLLTAGGDGRQSQWDVPSGKLLRELDTGLDSSSGFALAPDGKQFALAGFRAREPKVLVFNLALGKVVQSFLRNNVRESDCKLAFSADGTLLFSLAFGVLRVEEIPTGHKVLQRKFPADYAGGLIVSPDGAYVAIATGPNSRKLLLWKWQAEEPRELKAPQNGIRGIAFSPDGKLLAAVADNLGAVLVYEVPSGRLLYQRQYPDDDLRYSGDVTFTPNGKTLIVGLRRYDGSSRGRIHLLQPNTGQTQGVLETAGGRMAVAPDSRRLAVSRGQGVRIWELATRQELAPNDEAHFQAPSRILVSPRGFLVTASDDNTLRVWDAATGKQRRKFALDHWVRDIGLSPDGNLLAASCFDDRVHVWDPHTGREIYRLAGHGRVGGSRTLGFLPDGKGFLSWGDDLYLRLWDVKTGKARFEHAIRPKGLDIPEDENERQGKDLLPGRAVVSPDGKTFVLNIAGNFHVFDAATGKERLQFPNEDGFHSPMTISPNSKWLLAGLWASDVEKQRVCLWDLSTGTMLRRMEGAGRIGGAVAFSPDGRSFATFTEAPQPQILLYEVASGQLRGRVGGFRGRVWSLAFFPDGRRLAAGLSDSTVLIWDVTSP